MKPPQPTNTVKPPQPTNTMKPTLAPLLDLPSVRYYPNIAAYWNTYMSFRAEGAFTFTIDDVAQMLGAAERAIDLTIDDDITSWPRPFQLIEMLAQEIYETEMPSDGLGEKPPWVPCGNFLKQDEARDMAKKRLYPAPTAMLTGNPVHDAILEQLGILAPVDKDSPFNPPIP